MAASANQATAPSNVLAALEQSLGVRLGPGARNLPDGTRLALDGICEDPPILVGAWAHIGPPTSAQKHKVMTDALKLVWAEAVLSRPGPPARSLPGSRRAIAGWLERRVTSRWLDSRCEHRESRHRRPIRRRSPG